MSDSISMCWHGQIHLLLHHCLSWILMNWTNIQPHGILRLCPRTLKMHLVSTTMAMMYWTMIGTCQIGVATPTPETMKFRMVQTRKQIVPQQTLCPWPEMMKTWTCPIKVNCLDQTPHVKVGFIRNTTCTWLVYSGSHNWVNAWYFFIYCWIALD